MLFEEYASSYPYAEDGRIPAPSGTGLLEPLTTLSFLAAHTTTVRLGTAMVLLPQRNPVYTAKEVSTLDWLSNGRVDFGIGVGWLEEEFNAVNVPVAPAGPADRRVPRGAPHPVVRRDLRLRGGVLLAQPVPDVPQARPASPPPDPHRRASPTPPWPGWPGPARGGTPSTGRPSSWPSRWPPWTGCWPSRAGAAADVTVTVCPYFQPLDADIAGRYAEAGVDAVAALLLPFSEDDVRKALDDLQPVFDRAAAS